MTRYNTENERIKRKYFAYYLKEAMRNSEATVDAAAKALARFETHTRTFDFKAFHFEQAIAEKRLAEQKAQQSGERLSKATFACDIDATETFFQWLAWQPGYKSRLQYSDAEYSIVSGIKIHALLPRNGNKNRRHLSKLSMLSAPCRIKRILRNEIVL